MFRLTDDELMVVEICLEYCSCKAKGQLETRISCSAFAWHATRKAKAEVDALLARVKRHLQET